MSPERSKVFVVEDNEEWQNNISRILQRNGYEVVGTARTFDEAMDAVPTFESLGVNVAIVDGNLDEASFSGAHGKVVVAAIREQAPTVKTVGFSGMSVRGADVDLGKAHAIKLGETITQL